MSKYIFYYIYNNCSRIRIIIKVTKYTLFGDSTERITLVLFFLFTIIIVTILLLGGVEKC